jgi:lipopolysaccharide heptosyltransferase II
VTVTGKLLVVGPSWVGDMVMAQSLYRTIKAREPSAVIDVLAPAWSLPLLERMPEVARGIELPLAHGELGLARRRRLGRALRGRYTRAIVLPRSLKSALVPWFAGIERRTGFRGEWRFGLINDMRPFDPKRLDQTVKRFIALGLERGDDSLPPTLPPALRVDTGAQASLAARLALDPTGPVVALMPGAEYGPAKQWPTRHYAALAGRLAAQGAAVWILGSAKEAALGREIAEAAGGAAAVVNLAGQTTLVEAVDLLSLSRVAVSNDSGLMHIAAAVGTHVVALYGSSTPDFTPPLTANATICYRRLVCSPCFARECPLGHLDCLVGIGVDDVCASVERVLALPAQKA